MTRTVASVGPSVRVEFTIEGGIDPALVRVHERLDADDTREQLTVDDGDATGTWRYVDDGLEFRCVVDAEDVVVAGYACERSSTVEGSEPPIGDADGDTEAAWDPVSEPTRVSTTRIEDGRGRSAPTTADADSGRDVDPGAGDRGATNDTASEDVVTETRDATPERRAADGGPAPIDEGRTDPHDDESEGESAVALPSPEHHGVGTGVSARSAGPPSGHGSDDAGGTGASSTDVPTRPTEESEDDAGDDSRPAVGLVATASTLGAVARSVVRARDLGYPVFVIHDDTTGADAVRFTRQLGSRLVRPLDPAAGRDRLRRELATAVEQAGLPGVIVHDPRESVDYDRLASSLAASSSHVLVTGADDTEVRIGATGTLAAVPAYNEAETIAGIVAATSPHVDEVLVVDDGSTDGTVETARAAGATVVEHDRNRGYGGALKTAFREARRRDVDRLVTLDADGQHDPDDVPRLFHAAEERDAEVVIGSRFVEGGGTDAPLYRRIGLAVINAMTNASLGNLTGDRIRDTQSGFRVYGRRAVLTLAHDETIGEGMNASTDVLYHASRHGYDVTEVGVDIDYDVADASSHNPVAHGLTLLNNIVRTVERKRPLTVLGVPGFLAAFVGIAFGYWGILVYLDTRSFPVGLVITAVFFCLSGILTCFTAVILHALNTHLAGEDGSGSPSLGGSRT